MEAGHTDSEWELVCRLCLGEDARVPLAESELSRLLRECAGLEVRSGDGLPACACLACAAALPLHHAFVSRARRADLALRRRVALKTELDIDSKLEEDDTTSVGVQADDDDIDDYTLPLPQFINVDTDVKPDTDLRRDIEETHREASPPASPVKEIKRKKQKRNSKKPKSKVKKNKPEKKSEKTEKNKAVWTCETCGLKRPSPSSLERHMVSHTGERPYKCPECGKGFANPSYVSVHVLRMHKNIRNFMCEECGKGFVTPHELQMHLRTHTDEKTFKCNQCDRFYRQKGALVVHERTHTGERPFACDQCPKRFLTKQEMKAHRYVHTDLRPHVCVTCGMAFKIHYNLIVHQRSHKPDKKFVCDQCGASFRLRPALVAHLKKIHSERSGSCQQCGKYYPDLVSHMQWHKGESPHVCVDCGRTFSRVAGLTQHRIAQHMSRESLLHCPVEGCRQTFYLQFKLDHHVLKKHVRKDLHTCKKCSKEYLRLSDLSRHQESCLADLDPYICTGCAKGYSKYSDLRRHRKQCLAARNRQKFR